MDYYTQAWKQYFDFSGRTKRKDFWMFVLINFLLSLAISIIGGLIGIKAISSVYSLLVLIPSIAILVRRLRDAGFNVWWILIGLVPLVGFVVLIVLASLKSATETPVQNSTAEQGPTSAPNPTQTTL